MHFIWLSMYLARKYWLGTLYFCRLLETGPPFYVAIRTTLRSSHCRAKAIPWILNPLLSPPPSQISPFPLSSAPLQEKKVNKAPLPSPSYSSLINDLKYSNINHDSKTSCGLIRDGLFTSWKFGFDSDPRLLDLKLLVLKLFHFVF